MSKSLNKSQEIVNNKRTGGRGMMDYLKTIVALFLATAVTVSAAETIDSYMADGEHQQAADFAKSQIDDARSAGKIPTAELMVSYYDAKKQLGECASAATELQTTVDNMRSAGETPETELVRSLMDGYYHTPDYVALEAAGRTQMTALRDAGKQADSDVFRTYCSLLATGQKVTGDDLSALNNGTDVVDTWISNAGGISNVEPLVVHAYARYYNAQDNHSKLVNQLSTRLQAKNQAGEAAISLSDGWLSKYMDAARQTDNLSQFIDELEEQLRQELVPGGIGGRTPESYLALYNEALNNADAYTDQSYKLAESWYLAHLEKAGYIYVIPLGNIADRTDNGQALYETFIQTELPDITKRRALNLANSGVIPATEELLWKIVQSVSTSWYNDDRVSVAVAYWNDGIDWTSYTPQEALDICNKYLMAVTVNETTAPFITAVKEKRRTMEDMVD